jgi:hypothetical protein
MQSSICLQSILRLRASHPIARKTGALWGPRWRRSAQDFGRRLPLTRFTGSLTPPCASTFSRMIAPYAIFHLFTIDPSTARLPPHSAQNRRALGTPVAALRSGFRQEAPAHPLHGIAHASLRLNFLTHDCSLRAWRACRCPAVKVRWLSGCACGSPPGQRRWSAESR